MRRPILGPSQQGRLINANRELLALGECDLHSGGEITMHVAEEHVATPHRALGDLSLLLDDGRALAISNRFARLQLRGGSERTPANTIYRLHTLRN